MMILALFPPVFFKIMNKQVEDYKIKRKVMEKELVQVA